MADNTLQIEIDIGDAKAQLADLAQSFTDLGEATTAVGSKTGSAVQRLSDAMASLKPLDTTVINGIQNLGAAMELLQGGAGSINTLANELNKLARVDMDMVAQNVQKLVDALAQLKVPEGIDQIANAFKSIGDAATQVVGKVRGVKEPVDETQRAFEHLGKELINSAGYAMGISVSLGQMLGPIKELSREGMSFTAAFDGVTKSLGGLGGTVAVLGLVGLAMEIVGEKVKQFGEAVINATEKFEKFVITMDAVRGHGTGEEEYVKMSAAIDKSGQSVAGLTAASQKFLETTAMAGMSVEKSNKLYNDLLTVTGSLGLSTEKAGTIFEAFGRMIDKGSINMGDLGRRMKEIPGSASIFAAAMGVSNTQLAAMIKNNTTLTEDLPRLAARMAEIQSVKLPEMLATASAQAEKFSNTINQLLINMGTGGGLGGIATAWADGLKRLNEALQSDFITKFTQALGVLAGMLTGAIMGALSGFIQGITFVGNVITGIVEILAKSVGALLGWQDGWAKSLGVMKLVGSVAEGVGIVLGVLSTAWAFNKAIVIATTIAEWAGVASKIALRAALSEATIAQLSFNAAALTNPYVLLGVAVAALVAGLVIYARSAGDAGHQTDMLGQKVSETASLAQNASVAIKDWSNNTAKSATALSEAAAGNNSFEASLKSSKIELSNINAELKSNQAAMKDAQLSSRQAERDTRSFVLALEQQKTALTQARETMTRQNQDFKDSAKSAGESTKGLDMNHAALKNNQRAVQDLDIEIKHANQSLQDRKMRDQEWHDSIQTLNQSLTEAADIIKKYKVSLDAAQVSDVKTIENWGMEEAAAVRLVAQMKNLTQSTDDRAKAAQRNAEAAAAEVAFYQKWLDKINDYIKAETERLKLAGENDEAIKAQLKGQTDMQTQLTGLVQKNIQVEATQMAINIALRDNIPMTEAAGKAQEVMAKKYGVDVPNALKIQQDALTTLGGKAKEHADIHEEAAKKTSAAYEGLGKKVSEVFGKIGTVLVGATEALLGWMKTATTTVPPVDKAADSANKLGKSAEEAHPKLMHLGAAMEQIGKDTATGSVDNAGKSFEKLGTDADGAGKQVEKLAMSVAEGAKAFDIIGHAGMDAAKAAEEDEKYETARAQALGATVRVAGEAGDQIMELGRKTNTAAGATANHNTHLDKHRQIILTIVPLYGQKTQAVQKATAADIAAGDAMNAAEPIEKSKLQLLKEQEAALASASDKQLAYTQKLTEMRSVGSSLIPVVTGIKMVYKDISAQNAADLTAVRDKIEAYRSMTAEQQKSAIEAQKLDAIEKSQVKATQDYSAALGKGKDMQAAITAEKQKANGATQAEIQAAGQLRNVLIEENKARQEELTQMQGGARANLADIASKKALIAATDEQIKKTFEVQEAGGQAIKTQNEYAASQMKAVTAQQAAAAASTADAESKKKVAEVVKLAETGITSFNISNGEWVLGMTRGTAAAEAFNAKGEKLGEVLLDSKGKVLAMSDSLLKIPGALDQITNSTTPVGKAFNDVSKNIGDNNAVMKIWNAEVDGAKKTGALLKDTFLGIADASQKGFLAAGDWTKSKLGAAFDNIAGSAKDFIDVLKGGDAAQAVFAKNQTKIAEETQKQAEETKRASQADAEAKAKKDALRITTQLYGDTLTAVNAGSQTQVDKLKEAQAAETEFLATQKAVQDGLQAQLEKEKQAQAVRDAEIEQAKKLADAYNQYAQSGDNVRESLDKVKDSSDKLNGANEKVKSSTDLLIQQGPSNTAQLNNQDGAINKLATDDEKLAIDAAKAAAAQSQVGKGGGGGGLTDSLTPIEGGRTGGISGSLKDTQMITDMSVFSKAPHLAQGTANTSGLPTLLPGAGKPAVLHSNEAVVPLSGGRSIPVEFSAAALAALATTSNNGATAQQPVVLTPVVDAITSMSVQMVDLLGQLNLGVTLTTKAQKDQLALQKANQNSGGTSGLANNAFVPIKLIDGPSQRALHGSDPTRAHPLRTNVDQTGQVIQDAVVPGAAGGGGDSGPAKPARPVAPTQNVIINYNSGQFDDFRMTKSQLAKVAKDAIDKANRQNG